MWRVSIYLVRDSHYNLYLIGQSDRSSPPIRKVDWHSLPSTIITVVCSVLFARKNFQNAGGFTVVINPKFCGSRKTFQYFIAPHVEVTTSIVASL